MKQLLVQPRQATNLGLHRWDATSITYCINNHLSNQHFQFMLNGFFKILFFESCLGWLYTKNTDTYFSTGAFRVGGLKGQLKQVQGSARAKRRRWGAQTSLCSCHGSCHTLFTTNGMKKNLYLSGHSPAYTCSRGRWEELCLYCSWLTEGKLEVSTTDSSCWLQVPDGKI